MIGISWDELRQATSGEWLAEPPAAARAGVMAVCDDSRQVQAGDLFVAMHGEFTDGHRYLDAALAAGAAAVCVSDTPDATFVAAATSLGVAVLRVADGLAAYQALARRRRQRSADLCLIGVTGSSGKTSTKEMIAAVLEAGFPGRVLKTEGNTNNHFGVPRNLLRLRSRHRAAVIEMGSNHPGEIRRLATLAQPDVGVVSNIGRAHLEFFGDLSGVAREKGDLLACTHPGGSAVFPAEGEGTAILTARAAGRRTLTFGAGAGAAVRIRYLGRAGDGYAVRVGWPDGAGESVLEWGIGGAHQAMNAGAAAAAGLAAGLTPATIIAGLAACHLPAMRMEVVRREGVTWVNDAYNANPDSMRAAVRWFAEMTATVAPAQCHLILGDMFELGSDGPREHEAVLRWARSAARGEIVAVGALMAAAGAAVAGVVPVADTDAVRAYLSAAVSAGDWVLLKASRGMGLERVMPPCD